MRAPVKPSEANPLVDTPPPLGHVLEFMRSIWALDHALQKRSKRMKRAQGITGPQRLVLRIVGRFPGISAGQLAELLHVHKSTLTGVLDRLERRGLISRRQDPQDGRRSFFGLTKSGRAIETKHEGTVEATVRKVLSDLPRVQVVTAENVLRRLTEALEDD
ncbi:MAG: MarR family transcriptional regulator [Deltaproteobacteria bacterium]|nr:MarR family transcriptional regulator [Deltaproteobacteria bacterium]